MVTQRNAEILEYLKEQGQKLDSEIAAAMGMSLREARLSLSSLSAQGEISSCFVTRFDDGKPSVQGMLCRIAASIPPRAPGRTPGAKQ